jgi:hypothetical protein
MTRGERELVMVRWGMPPPRRAARLSGHEYPQHLVAALAGLAETGKSMLSAGQLLCRVCTRAEPGDQKEGCRMVRAE